MTAGKETILFSTVPHFKKAIAIHIRCILLLNNNTYVTAKINETKVK